MTSSTPTLRDVAAEAGVSPMTASNALRGKPGVKESTRAKVIAAAKKLNYRINLTASMLKSGRSNIIHVIVNEFDSPFYSKLTQALSNEIVSRGLIPFIEQTQYSPDAAEHALSSNPFSGQLVDGEILHATGLGTNVPLCSISSTADAAISRSSATGSPPAPIWRMPRTRSLCDCAAHAERCPTPDCPMTSRWCSKPGMWPMASSPGMRLRNVFSPHGADMVAPSSTARAAPTISRRSA